ncbi:MAG: hypothetical protein ACKPFA_35610, partial [Dolichospermum sp.]
EDPIGFYSGDTNFYRYVFNNSINHTDAYGLAPNQGGATDSCHVRDALNNNPDLGNLKDTHRNNTNRYFYTDQYGWVDIRHFAEAARRTSGGEWAWWTETLGFGNEVVQYLTEWGDDYRSGFSPEDLPSNSAGANFGQSIRPGESLVEAFDRWSKQAGARPKSDPNTGFNNLPLNDPSERGGKGRGSNSSSKPQRNGNSSSPNSSCSC